MKKVVFFAVLVLVVFSSKSCSSGSGSEIFVNRIVFMVDGIVKDFRGVMIQQAGSNALHVRAQIGSEVIEAIEFEVQKNVTGTSAVSNMIFTQNNVEFYAFSGVQVTVTRNDEERKIEGNFSGNFRTLSGTNKFISNGTFSFQY